MRALTYLRPSRIEWRDAPEPRIEDDTDAIVRPFIAGRCDGDLLYLRGYDKLLRVGASLHILDDALRHENFFTGPFAYGHEAIGEVIETAPSVRRHKKGDIVVIPWALSCGSCSKCRRGLTSHCEANGKAISAFGFGSPLGGHGGLVSDAVRVPHADHMLHRVPDGIDPLTLAAAGDNLCDAYRTVAPHLQQRENASVLVIGGAAKSVGLYATGIAIAVGAGSVDYIDASRSRLEIAERFGANVFDRRRGSFDRRPGGYDIVVEASSTTEGLQQAIRSLAPGGICTAVGFYLRRGTALPLWPMYLRSGTLHVGIGHPGRDLGALLTLVASGAFKPEYVVPQVADWNDAPRALLEPATKLVLRRDPLHVAI